MRIDTGTSRLRLPMWTDRELDLLDDLDYMWSAAAEDETQALRAWCAGESSYDAFIAALDREEAAARELERHLLGLEARSAGLPGEA